MTERVAKLPVDRPEDVFALRQSARVAAALVGCDEADQVRLATALSELGREALAAHGGSSAVFSLGSDGALLVEIERFPREATLHERSATGLDAARKLVDDVVVSEGSDAGTVTVTLRRLPSIVRAAANAEDMRAALARTGPLRPLDELRLENRDLIATLEELKAKQDQLVRLNAELEETNRGVMAMYAQLADELEETNRGVVALYAELDDKTVRLNEANNAKSRFLASVSHELRSPVNSILGLARLLADPEGDPLTDDQRKQMGFILNSARDLLALVNELLDLAKAESGRLHTDIARVDLAEIFSELRGALRPLVRPGVELQVELPQLAPIETDRTLLAQVLRNLLTNALKFTTSGTVRLAARQSTSHAVEITVSDTGIGIAADDQQKVFEEFYQVRGPLQTEQRGTGLGLPYARRVSETLGGQLRLQSELGRGSVFTVQLPTAWQPMVRAAASPGHIAQAIRVGTVVIVDDDEAFRASLRGMLQGTAAKVIEAHGGIEGLRVIREARPEIAFVDLRMPDMDGADVLAALKSDPGMQAIPIVIVTSVDLTTGTRTTLGAAAALLSKSSVDRESVQLVLANVLGTSTPT